MINSPGDVRVVLHGSFQRHFDAILEAHAIFTKAGFTVLAPDATDIIGFTDGFAVLEGEEGIDPRQVELRYLLNLKNLGVNGFSYFVNPGGYVGPSTAYELGIAQLTGVSTYFTKAPSDHPAYIGQNAVWSPRQLADYILTYNSLPSSLPTTKDNYLIHRLLERLLVPGSIVAVGAIIEHESPLAEKELLFVKTHKWGGRYSMIGEKVHRGERLHDTLTRGIREETGLRAKVGSHLTTFDQIRDSGYFKSHINHIFADYTAIVPSKKVTLNEEAQDYIWLTARQALAELPIEPNARHTLNLYTRLKPSE